MVHAGGKDSRFILHDAWHMMPKKKHTMHDLSGMPVAHDAFCFVSGLQFMLDAV